MANSIDLLGLTDKLRNNKTTEAQRTRRNKSWRGILRKSCLFVERGLTQHSREHVDLPCTASAQGASIFLLIPISLDYFMKLPLVNLDASKFGITEELSNPPSFVLSNTSKQLVVSPPMFLGFR